jgi:hypothetical protein
VEKSNPTAAVALILVWAALGSVVLVVRRRGTWGWPLTWAALGSAAVMVLWWGGLLAWDRGLTLHGREVVLPGDQGRFTSLEASLPAPKTNALGWSEASPWALELWKAGPRQAGFVRMEGPRRLVQEAFLPAVSRDSEFRIRWVEGLRWWQRSGVDWTPREEAPGAFGPDLGWLARWAAAYPEATWTVGRDGVTCWLRPELAEGAP